MFFSKTGRSMAIRGVQRKHKAVISVCESNNIARTNRELSRKSQALNKKWLMELEKELRETLIDMPVVLSMFEEKLFSVWAKKHYYNKYTLAHVHIFELCDSDIVPMKTAQFVEAVVINSYTRYELETGEKVKLVRRIKQVRA